MYFKEVILPLNYFLLATLLLVAFLDKLKLLDKALASVEGVLCMPGKQRKKAL
jgi:hypothetical protein